MRQLWGQRKNCAVAQPGGQASGAAAVGSVGFGGAWWAGGVAGAGNFGHSTPRLRSDAAQAIDFHREASSRRVRRVLAEISIGVAVAGVAVCHSVGSDRRKNFPNYSTHSTPRRRPMICKGISWVDAATSRVRLSGGS
jgi:hypothetical protein